MLVGANPSVVRAALMGGLGLFAGQVGRRQTGLNSLAVTAAAMCVFSPNLPWDVSFQLSFMATLGLILYATPFQAAFDRLASRILPAGWVQRLSRPVGDYFLFTLAAQIVTFPVMAYHFKNFSLVSLLANPLVLPPQPLVMVLGGVAVLGGLVSPLLGQVLAWPFAAYTNRVVEWLASIPHGLVNFGTTRLWIWVAFYAILYSLTFFGSALASHWRAWRSRGIGQGVRNLLQRVVTPYPAILAAAVLAVLAWSAASSAPDGRLHLVLFEGGAPGTLLVQTPNGRFVLLVGGPMTGQLSQANNISVWDGNGWGVFNNGTNGTVYAVSASSNSNVFIGGSFTSPENHVAKWTGSWNPLVSGVNSTVYALTTPFNNNWVVLGGAFTDAGGVTAADHIAIFGLGWAAVGAGLDNNVNAVYRTDDGWVYAGGDFTISGITGLSHIGRWNSSGWSALGSGTDDAVNALAYDNSKVYAGGDFMNAGGKPSAFFGRWGPYLVHLPVIKR